MPNMAIASRPQRKRARPPEVVAIPTDPVPDNARLPSGDKQTAWAAVTQAYPCVLSVYPSPPSHKHNLSFLAGEPAAGGALTYCMASNPKVFALPAGPRGQSRNLKAALAQAAGIIAKIPCDNCAAGKGLWATCNQAPTRPGQSKDLFAGICPSCFYNGRASKCHRPPVPSTPASSGSESAHQLAPPSKRRRLSPPSQISEVRVSTCSPTEEHPNASGHDESTEPPVEASGDMPVSSVGSPSPPVELEKSPFPRVRSDLQHKRRFKRRFNPPSRTAAQSHPSDSSGTKDCGRIVTRSRRAASEARRDQDQPDKGADAGSLEDRRVAELEQERDEYRAKLQVATAKIAKQGQQILLLQSSRLIGGDDEAPSTLARAQQRQQQTADGFLEQAQDERTEEGLALVERSTAREAELPTIRDAESMNGKLQVELDSLRDLDVILIRNLVGVILDLRRVEDEEKRRASEAHQEQLTQVEDQLKRKTEELTSFREQSALAAEAAEAAQAHHDRELARQVEETRQAEQMSATVLRQRIQDLEQRLEKSEAAAEEGRAALRKAENKHETASKALKDKAHEVAQANEEIARLRSAEKDAQRQASMVPQLEAQLEDAKKKLLERDAELRHQLQAKDDLTRAVQGLNDEIGRRQKAEQMAACNLSSAKSSESRLRQELELVNEQLAAQVSAGARAQREISILQPGNMELRKNVDTLNASLAQARHAFQETYQKLQALETADAELQDAFNEQGQKMRDKEHEAREATTTIKDLRERLDSRTLTLKALEAERKFLADQFQQAADLFKK